MDPRELAEEIVRYGKRLGADDVAAIVAQEKRRMLRFSNNSVTVVQNWESTTPIVYMTKEGKRASTAAQDPTPEVVKEMMKNLMSTTKVMKRGDVEARLPKGPFKYRAVPETYDPRIPRMMDKLADAAESAINSAFAEGALRTSGVIITNEWKRFVKTSAGADGSDKGTYIEMTVRAFSADDASGQGNSCSATLTGFDPTGAGRQAGEIARLAREPKEGREGRYKVVFAPPVMANLLDTAADAASAYFVDLGLSYFAEQVGKVVASEHFTMLSDSRYPHGPMSGKLDDEGYPTQTTPVIEKGVLRTYLHNSYTATKYGAQLTGSAQYVGGVWGILPTARNIVVEPGDYSKEEIFGEAKEGLYITNNWYTRFQNYRTGDFSTLCRDGVFEIKAGKITQPVRGLRISDNMLRIIRSIAALSRERVWIKWWEVPRPTLLPHFLVDDVGITRAK